MSPQLAALFAQNKTAILGAAAAGVVGLALWQKKKGPAGAAAAPAAGTVPGALPAAAVVAPSTGGAYDSSSYDVYNALQPELEQILQTRGSGINSAPSPTSSPLFSDGAYRVAGQDVVYLVGNGGTTRDWLTGNEYRALGYQYGNDPNVQTVSGDDPRWAATHLVGTAPREGNPAGAAR